MSSPYARPEAGFMARQAAAMRASTGPGGFAREEGQKRRALDYSVKSILPSTAVGSTVGTAAGLAHGLYKGIRGTSLAAHAAKGGLKGIALAVPAAMSLRYTQGVREDLAEKGIETKMGVVRRMTPEAKSKYLHKKYEGGGYYSDKKSKTASVLSIVQSL